jgi:hypothetical protein
VKLVDFDSGFILKSLLIVINYVELVLVILKKHPSMIDQVSHVAFKVEHDATYLLNNLIDGKYFMPHLLQLRGAITAHSNSCRFIEISNLIHIVIGARVRDASRPGDTCGHSFGGNKTSRIL